MWAGFPVNITVKVKNLGNSAQGPTGLTLNAGQISILGENVLSLGAIPPFGQTTYQFNLRTPFLWQGFDDVVEITVAGQKITKKVIVQPFFLFAPFPYLFIAVLALIGIGYGSVLGLHIYKKRSKSKKQ
ncbi:MAG: hypothetical protein UV41_C0013G0007 [Candidatus Daviesbacteria bacterium GW2011_GWA2_42_7]|uniref:CARDB domain-containing protein n=1 Tax=Candidatus Daviesbacteria bacterium GW2011_GWA2_42_7 TaxID=1618425 RepID=A0A0G1BBY4_9BACT|nr:MAG: hypothetical protein UV41_C0013G0007 [Candidatus Daviesbacteria bacterium GW2011_GWA2_42_7]